MSQNNNLQKALIMFMDAEVQSYIEEAGRAPHRFSREFEEKMQNLIKDAEKRSKNAAVTNEDIQEPKRVRLFGKAVRRSVAILIAAVLVLGMTAVAIAAINPEIYFAIKDLFISWEINPQSENEITTDEVIPVKVESFGEYVLVDEYADDIIYSATYSDGRGHEIRYSQTFSEGLTISLDAEGIDTYTTKINNRNAIISRHDDEETSIVIENGLYVFTLRGDCPFDELYQVAEMLASS